MIKSGYQINESTSDREDRRITRKLAEEVLRDNGKNNSIGTYDKYIRDMVNKWSGTGHDNDFLKNVMQKALDKYVKANKLDESVDTDDMLTDITKLFDDNKIRYSFRGKNKSMILVPKKDLEKASELARTVDKDFKITVASQA